MSDNNSASSAQALPLAPVPDGQPCPKCGCRYSVHDDTLPLDEQGCECSFPFTVANLHTYLGQLLSSTPGMAEQPIFLQQLTGGTLLMGGCMFSLEEGLLELHILEPEED